jgi:Mce-associated membrane protein
MSKKTSDAPSDATLGSITLTESSETDCGETIPEPDYEKRASDPAAAEEDTDLGRRVNWSRIVGFGVLPALALVLAVAVGFVKWQASSADAADTARIESVAAARDAIISMLSYRPDTVERQLGAAQNLLTGAFRDSYTSLTNQVVIPGAKQKQITAVATVPAASSISADAEHAVALVFVNQTVTIGKDAPSDTASTVKVTMVRAGNRWLISDFRPI